MVPKLTPRTMYNDIILNIGYNLTYHPLRLIFFHLTVRKFSFIGGLLCRACIHCTAIALKRSALRASSYSIATKFPEDQRTAESN